MICENCNKNKATVHFVKVLNGKKKHLFLCGKCAGKIDDIAFDDKESKINELDFHKILNGLVDYLSNEEYKKVESMERETCNVCGTTYEEFKKNDVIGCKDCIDAFDNTIKDKIKKLHGNLKHKGRAPKKIREEINIKQNIIKLKLELDEAIKMENYEVAANLRDEIKKQEEFIRGRGDNE